MNEFTPGQLTTSQARRLNELSRMMESWSRLTVSPPLNISRPAGIPTISMPTPESVTEPTGSGNADDYAITSNDTWEDTGMSVTLTGPGSYIVFATVTADAAVSAIGGSAVPKIVVRLYDVTNSQEVYPNTSSESIGGLPAVVVSPQIVSRRITGYATMFVPFFITVSTLNLRLEAMRVPNGGTFTTSALISAVGSSGTTLGFVRLS
jgi:hypothetical protein